MKITVRLWREARLHPPAMFIGLNVLNNDVANEIGPSSGIGGFSGFSRSFSRGFDRRQAGVRFQRIHLYLLSPIEHIEAEWPIGQMQTEIIDQKRRERYCFVKAFQSHISYGV